MTTNTGGPTENLARSDLPAHEIEINPAIARQALQDFTTLFGESIGAQTANRVDNFPMTAIWRGPAFFREAGEQLVKRVTANQTGDSFFISEIQKIPLGQAFALGIFTVGQLFNGMLGETSLASAEQTPAIANVSASQVLAGFKRYIDHLDADQAKTFVPLHTNFEALLLGAKSSNMKELVRHDPAAIIKTLHTYLLPHFGRFVDIDHATPVEAFVRGEFSSLAFILALSNAEVEQDPTP